MTVFVVAELVQSLQSVNDVNFGSDGRFCVAPASQLRLRSAVEHSDWLERQAN